MADVLPTGELDRLIDVIRDQGYRVIGPTMRDGAIVYADIGAARDLPIGWTDEQGPGHYRLVERQDKAAFGYVVGPHSWKRFLFPPREQLVQIRVKDETTTWSGVTDDGTPMAFLGVRGCELAAIGIQDQVFTAGPFVDGRYKARRDRCLIIAVNCTEAGQLCFCDSMGTGPRAEGDYDIRITEVAETLVIEAGSDRGRSIVEQLPTEEDAGADDTASAAIEACRAEMGRTLDTDQLPARLMGNLEHPRWKDVAERCLSCGNCTLACPTCFCFNINDTSDLTGAEAGRERTWDSCFTADHSSIHGAQFRAETGQRYQQWITHKLATWTAQFGTSGCVGCGRCIAWCPVGIDFTEEASIIAAGEGAPMTLPEPIEHPRGEHDGQVPFGAQVTEVTRETEDVVTLVLDTPADHTPAHGQFNMLSLPGVGDVPISLSGVEPGSIEHTIRAVGIATTALCDLRVGETVGVRGRVGSAWPLELGVGRPVIVVAGGIGLAPLRSAIREMVRRPDDFAHVRILYGTRSPSDILYDRELLGWMQAYNIHAHVTVDRGDRAWTGNIGVVTKLMRRKRVPADGLYLLCGPEIMMRFALGTLFSRGVPQENIYLSMERNMKCAAGMCGRCQYGPYFICKDGPVFRYDQIADIFGKPGF